MKKIMFNDEYGLTTAVLEGRKVQTRRLSRFGYKHPSSVKMDDGTLFVFEQFGEEEPSRYKIGEEIAIAQSYKDIETSIPNLDAYVDLRSSKGWRNKMFTKPDLLPHRIKITDIRIERLQDISDEDCIKEGVEIAKSCCDYYVRVKNTATFPTPQEAFACLLDKVSSKGTWERNPYVFVYEFELVK